MCTLSYIPTESGYIFTHNRDEHALREPALAPTKYRHGAIDLIYPKDGRAGGTWIASNGNITACLLNGAFEKHKHLPPYRKSRGLVLLDSFKYGIEAFGSQYDFTGIEPFTLIRVKGLDAPFALRWDGNDIHESQLNRIPLILSSSTLYSIENRQAREFYFHQFLATNASPTPGSIFSFHGLRHSGDLAQDFIMERESGVKTLSISQVILQDHELHFIYADKMNQTLHWLANS